jgi:hypothetical protein
MPLIATSASAGVAIAVEAFPELLGCISKKPLQDESPIIPRKATTIIYLNCFIVNVLLH